MSGLVKAKEYDWKDSNMALFGTPLEREIKMASAETEKAWHVVKDSTGATLFVWRIVKFVPTLWPEDQAGEFYDGDSYIVLNKYKDPESDKFLYDVHFWIGKFSSQDEYGTAAYKTVELDTFLDDAAIQHREVQDNESKLFKSYFKHMTILKGGADSGFRHVEAAEYKPRLIQVIQTKNEKGGSRIEAREVEYTRKSINDCDVFVLDKGKNLVQFNGKASSPMEKHKAGSFVSDLKSSHGGADLNVIDENQASERDIEKFLEQLPDADVQTHEKDDVPSGPKQLKRLSDAAGHLELTDVASGDDITFSMFDADDVFIYDTGAELYVYVGENASVDERRKCMEYGHNYLMQTTNKTRTIVCIKGNHVPKYFKELF